MSIKVRATQLGYFGGVLREEGSEFEVSSKEDLGNWMLVLDEPKGKTGKAPKSPAENEDLA